MMQAIILDKNTGQEVSVLALMRRDVKRMLHLDDACLIPLTAGISRGELIVCCADNQSEFNAKMSEIAKQMGFEIHDVFVNQGEPWPGWQRRTDAD